MEHIVGPAGPAVVLEAVLHTDQLADVRRMLELRLATVDDDDLWRVVMATNELVTNALVHCGRCLGLRVYLDDDQVRIEVDDPSPVRIDRDAPGRGFDVIAGLASAWGDQVPGPDARVGGAGRHPATAAKTVWCELALSA